jgi:hypothetical protein
MAAGRRSEVPGHAHTVTATTKVLLAAAGALNATGGIFWTLQVTFNRWRYTCGTATSPPGQATCQARGHGRVVLAVGQREHGQAALP